MRLNHEGRNDLIRQESGKAAFQIHHAKIFHIRDSLSDVREAKEPCSLSPNRVALVARRDRWVACDGVNAAYVLRVGQFFPHHCIQEDAILEGRRLALVQYDGAVRIHDRADFQPDFNARIHSLLRMPTIRIHDMCDDGQR